MFVQIIQARAGDPAVLRAELDRWVAQQAPEAKGWLGFTGGISTAGEFFGASRFDSAESARRSSDRPEQGEWWAAFSKHLGSAATFHDCTNVELFKDGGSDDARFVQVIQGTATDPARMRAIGEALNSKLPALRPDVLGGITAWDGAHYSEIIYFTNEKDAREYEAKGKPDDVEALFDEMAALTPDLRYLDLNEPWLWSAR